MKPNCPTCSRVTTTQQLSPLYLSSGNIISKYASNTSDTKLKEKIAEQSKKRLRAEESLKESQDTILRLRALLLTERSKHEAEKVLYKAERKRYNRELVYCYLILLL